MDKSDSDLNRDEASTLFRSSKRRKVYRRRDDDEEVDPAEQAGKTELVPSKPATESPMLPANGEDVEFANIIKLRRQARNRKGGIEFSSAQHENGRESPFEELEAQGADPEFDPMSMFKSRFTTQTGQIADVNKHMMEYIDAELAKQRLGNTQLSKAELQEHQNRMEAGNSSSNVLLQRNPATLGRLQEVDLGPDSTAKNIAKTEALTSGKPEEQPVDASGRKRWRRRRRNSEDIRRDQLVEQVLGEHKLTLYEEGNSPKQDGINSDDEAAADDRIAEQFRRDFLDAVSNRRRRNNAPPTSAAAKKKTADTKTKGPKLGGSRSARAAMRAKEGK